MNSMTTPSAIIQLPVREDIFDHLLSQKKAR
jgi:hypothetical protein